MNYTPYCLHTCPKPGLKAEPGLPQDIAYIYEILHCNHFIILSKATAYDTSTINRCPSPVVVLMIHQNHHMAGTPTDCSCLICSGIAENDEVVAVEDFIDVGNILGKSWVSLWQHISCLVTQAPMGPLLYWVHALGICLCTSHKRPRLPVSIFLSTMATNWNFQIQMLSESRVFLHQISLNRSRNSRGDRW